MRSCSEKREEKDLPGAKDLRSVGDPREGGGSRGERWERPAGPGRDLEAPGNLGLCPEAERRWRGSEQLIVEITQARCGEHGGIQGEDEKLTVTLLAQRPRWPLASDQGQRPGLAYAVLGLPPSPCTPRRTHTKPKSQRAQGRKFDVFMTAQNGRN